jgi:serine/threonine protein phosphatase 1
MVVLPDARTPEGLRLYAIGDVHGRVDLLADMHLRIARDLARRPAAAWRVIHLGDYIDRGPDSARALGLLLDYQRGGHADFLLGNHDRFLRDFLQVPDRGEFELWMYNGGSETLDSFGFDGMMMAHSGRGQDLALFRDRLVAAIPPELPDFLAGLSLMRRFGDYVFVHAGVRPGVALEDQSEHDLVWIREPFLSSGEDHGAVVVHGHSVAEAVEVRPNRIGIDTGAVFTGNLTCLVLEGAERALLGADGPEPFIDC